MTTVWPGTEANSGATAGIRPNGMDRTMTSLPWTASAAVTACAPNSRASASVVSGPRELATATSCPPALSLRSSVVPIGPCR
jgi:hypothetical protein